MAEAGTRLSTINGSELHEVGVDVRACLAGSSRYVL